MFLGGYFTVGGPIDGLTVMDPVLSFTQNQSLPGNPVLNLPTISL